MLYVGVDIGGTFTDIVVSDGSTHQTRVLKVPTSSADPALALVKSLGELGILNREIGLVSHASTIATNALLTRTGLASTALVTTEGFRDVLEIARQRRPELYNLYTRRPAPLVRRRDRHVVRERTLFNGRRQAALDSAGAVRAARKVAQGRYQAVAVAFLNSYANPANEIAMEKALRREGFAGHISLSSDVDREYREYERTSTTVVNAALSPLISGYLTSLRDALRENGIGAPVYMMGSDGGMSTLAYASRYPVRVIESGPAAGVLASRELARALAIRRALTFDMGGTTAKAGSVLDGEPDTSFEFEAAGATHSGRSIRGSGYTVRAPFIDIAEVSSGGGTIAWVDEAGALRVGPSSAGAEPGPAAYGRGGIDPTVTDADLLLGRLNGEHLLGGALAVHPHLAEKAMERVADALGLSVQNAAVGVLRIVNDNMAKAMSMVSVERGRDPRDFAMIAFGGAGPVHCCDVAEALGLRLVVVPVHAGTFSAYGLLAGDLTRTFSVPVLSTRAALEPYFDEARALARRSLSGEGFKKFSLHEFADLRYRGQSYELTLPYSRSSDVREGFGARHRELYGYSSEDEVEVVNAKVKAVVPTASVRTEVKRVRAPAARPGTEKRRAWFGRRFHVAPVLVRENLEPGSHGKGPCIVEEYDSTLVVNPGWTWSVQAFGTELRR